MSPYSIAGINRLPTDEKRRIYFRFVPETLLSLFDIGRDLTDRAGRSLVRLEAQAGSSDVILELRHAYDAEDPTLYAHLTDTVNGQIHVLLYITNDPRSPRFDVDRMPDGTPTQFGTKTRNLQAEEAAFRAGLAPGQVRRGLRILRQSVEAFEGFVVSLGHDVYFVDPLFYHNAIIFEGYGFAYLRGQRLMEDIQRGFSRDGQLRQNLNGGTIFRKPEAADSIRGRSWAIHDGILGAPFSDVTMYRRIGRDAQIATFPGGSW
jgi:hypothetical protein